MYVPSSKIGIGGWLRKAVKKRKRRKAQQDTGDNDFPGEVFRRGESGLSPSTRGDCSSVRKSKLMAGASTKPSRIQPVGLSEANIRSVPPQHNVLTFSFAPEPVFQQTS